MNAYLIARPREELLAADVAGETVAPGGRHVDCHGFIPLGGAEIERLIGPQSLGAAH